MSDARTTNNARANNPENVAINTGAARDVKTGRFLAGNSGGGRPKGSRNKLGEQFIADVYSEWQKSGADALKKMSAENPSAFVRVVAGILPKEIDATLTVNADLFAEVQNFRAAYEFALNTIGADDIEADEPLMIEHDNADE